jgi:ribosomal protein S18 acetylase RimI-like enzyme
MVEETLPDNKEAVRLRAVTPQDESFLLRVYASTRAEELALVPWDEAQREAFIKMQFDAQLNHYRSNFPSATQQIIERASTAVGRLYVLRTDEFTRILDITVLPEFRSAGIGTPIIRDLMAEAAEAKKPLRIFVESFNPSLRLFERLGFHKTLKNGFHLLMEWNSSDSNTADE